jgi:hypothetical protein
MILHGSAGRICHLENVKFYFSYLQQCTKIIKMKNDKTIIAYFVEYTVEKFEKFLII